MKRAIKLGMLFILVAVLCSCGTFKLQTQPAPYFLPENAILKLNASQPIAIKNVSSKVPGTEDILCGWRTIRVMGNSYDFTESTIGIVKCVHPGIPHTLAGPNRENTISTGGQIGIIRYA